MKLNLKLILRTVYIGGLKKFQKKVTKFIITLPISYSMKKEDFQVYQLIKRVANLDYFGTKLLT